MKKFKKGTIIQYVSKARKEVNECGTNHSVKMKVLEKIKKDNPRVKRKIRDLTRESKGHLNTASYYMRGKWDRVFRKYGHKCPNKMKARERKQKETKSCGGVARHAMMGLLLAPYAMSRNDGFQENYGRYLS